MKPLVKMVLGVMALTAVAAAAGGWIGIHYALNRPSAGLDELIHHHLNLDKEQEKKLEVIEEQFSERRKALEQEMREANRDLAAAIRTEYAYGSKARSAIKRFHGAESVLQEETVKHILHMRSVLTPEQARQFDDEISRALTSE